MPRGRPATKNGASKRLGSQQSVDQAIKSICDIMRRGNCAGAMQYVPELTWILFLRILDEREEREAEEARALGIDCTPSLEKPYRWRDWAAPPDRLPKGAKSKRADLEKAPQNSFFDFVNKKLLPYLRGLERAPSATPRQKVISEIMSGVERVRIDTERNLLDVLDKVHELTGESVDTTHVFALSQVYEGLLLKMGEKGNDGGQFFTPRQVIKAMVRVIDPKPGESIYDPGCGTGGFLAQSFEHIVERLGAEATASHLEELKQRGFWGREKENLVYPMALANLVLHGIDKPNLWHGNTLTGQESYGGLFEGAPQAFDVILTNPPFGGKEGKEAQTNFDYKTGATQVLFLQHVIRNLKEGGRCGIVLDEGLLFRTNEEAFAKTKRKLLDDCELWCVVSLPGGVFTAAGAGVKTNLLFFTKGKSTRKIWYYDLSNVKVGKKTPLTLGHFEEFFRLLPKRAESENSWTVDFAAKRKAAAADATSLKARAKASDDFREAKELAARAAEVEAAVYDLKAVNPNRKRIVDERSPEELIGIIEEKGREIAKALQALKNAK